MLILLPILAFVLTFVVVMGREASVSPELISARRAALQTAVLLGGYVAIGSEILSLFRALDTLWVSILWIVLVAVVLLAGWTSGWLALGLSALRGRWRRPDGFDISAATLLALVLGLLLLVALKSPSNNNDAIQYHMPRVMHWAQSGTLAHYATPYAAQVLQPIDAELMILHARLLRGNDALANVIQWMSLIGTLIAVSAITKLFSGGKLAQWSSVAFVASLPLGLLEATSAQNDLVTAFYLTCLLFFVFRPAVEGARRSDPIWVGLALGLGILTKATFYAYAVAPMVFLLIWIARNQQLRQAIEQLFLVAVIVVALNLGGWGRNVISFGSPLGQAGFVASHVAGGSNPAAWLGGLARNIAQNLVTPSEQINHQLIRGLKVLSPLDPEMKQFSLEWGWNHEDLAGNPLHLVLMLVSSIILIVFRRRLAGRYTLGYPTVVIASYIIFAAVVQYLFYGVRLQLPFFAAFAPMFAAAIDTIAGARLSKAIVLLLLIAAFPWALFNRTRPLIAMRPSHDPFTIPCLAGCTTGSILVEPPETTMFAVWGNERRDDYVGAMELLASTACRDIGLKTDSSDLEYVYWWLLDAPQSGRRLESLNPLPELERYLDPGFKPCAIICTDCGKDQPTLNGLDLAGEFGEIKIYLLPEYRPAR
jgi:hypothetical protein